MAKYVRQDEAGRIAEQMFSGFGRTPAEDFLRKELERYVPQFSGMTDDEVREFAGYQRAVYLDGDVPELGRPIACLNPTFVDSVKSIKLAERGLEVYTRASTKENGYRMQLHTGEEPVAYTRQFTRYDLRMFPELEETIAQLPVMIGDAELVNKRYRHLAGFNRVQVRIPNAQWWPRQDEEGIDDSQLDAYLESDVVGDDEFELTLAFHGLFAIADPSTWDKDRDEQLKSLESLCPLPMDYQRVDELLDQLAQYIEEKGLNARVVHREVVQDRKALEAVVREHDEEGYEGVCVVQVARDGSGERSFDFGKSVKIKKYETIDTALLGLYMKDPAKGVQPGNLRAALVGLYDDRLSCYLPVCRVNLDPQGVQVKTKGQRERLELICEDIGNVSVGDAGLVTLYDAYARQGTAKLGYALEATGVEYTIGEEFEEMLATMPRGQTILSLLERYDAGDYSGKSQRDQFVKEHEGFFGMLCEIRDTDRWRDVNRMLVKEKDVKDASKKLPKPDVMVDPLIIETRVFGIKWALNPMPAGFHSWYCDSFHFNNVFPERVRHDKQSTTDYQTIYDLARVNTVRNR